LTVGHWSGKVHKFKINVLGWSSSSFEGIDNS
jgi:hypothetical protein